MTEDIAHGLMYCAGMVDADMASDSDRFDTDPQWQQASRAQEYMVKLARWKLAQVRERRQQANAPVVGRERSERTHQQEVGLSELKGDKR